MRRLDRGRATFAPKSAKGSPNGARAPRAATRPEDPSRATGIRIWAALSLERLCLVSESHQASRGAPPPACGCVRCGQSRIGSLILYTLDERKSGSLAFHWRPESAPARQFQVPQDRHISSWIHGGAPLVMRMCRSCLPAPPLDLPFASLMASLCPVVHPHTRQTQDYTQCLSRASISVACSNSAVLALHAAQFSRQDLAFACRAVRCYMRSLLASGPRVCMQSSTLLHEV